MLFMMGRDDIMLHCLKLAGGWVINRSYSMLGCCLQGCGDDTTESRQTGVQDVSSQQVQEGDKAEPDGEFWRQPA